MIPKFALVGAGFAAGLVGPNLGRTLLKQAVRVGLAGTQVTKHATQVVKEQVKDMVAEIEHEATAKAAAELASAAKPANSRV